MAHGEPGWDSTFDTPGADQVTKMKAIITSLPWWEMVPDQGLFATGIGSERTLTRPCASRGWRRVLVPVEPDDRVLHLDKIAAKNVQVTWISPVTGETKDAGTYLTGNLNGKTFPESKTQMFTVPGHWEDALLLLEGVE